MWGSNPSPHLILCLLSCRCMWQRNTGIRNRCLLAETGSKIINIESDVGRDYFPTFLFKEKDMTKKKNKKLINVLQFAGFGFPALFFWMSVVIIPFIYGIWITFSDWNGLAMHKLPFSQMMTQMLHLWIHLYNSVSQHN